MNKIILASSLCLLLSACSDDSAKNMAKQAADKTAEATTEVVKSAAEKVVNTADAGSAALEKKAAVEEAKMITKAFGGALKAELQTAVKAGGPVNALDVCNTKANPIAEKVAKEQNAQLSRVSLKNRNPNNVPNDWQKTVLEDFDARAAKGEDVKAMGFANIVEENGKKQLRFMKALPTTELCLTCHGSTLPNDVQAKLTELYPDDKATGYEQGQVRGAVVVIKDLN